MQGLFVETFGMARAQELFVEAFGKTQTPVILHCTNSDELFVKIIKTELKQPAEILVYCVSKRRAGRLRDQLADIASLAGGNPELIQNKNGMVLFCPVQAAMDGSIKDAVKQKWLDSVDIILVQDADHMSPEFFGRCLKETKARLLMTCSGDDTDWMQHLVDTGIKSFDYITRDGI